LEALIRRLINNRFLPSRGRPFGGFQFGSRKSLFFLSWDVLFVPSIIFKIVSRDVLLENVVRRLINNVIENSKLGPEKSRYVVSFSKLHKIFCLFLFILIAPEIIKCILGQMHTQ
jgi:hypothetical protein